MAEQRRRIQNRIGQQPADASGEPDHEEVAQTGVFAGRGFALRSDHGPYQQRSG